MILTFSITVELASQKVTNAYHPVLGYLPEIKVPFEYQQGFIIIDLVLQKALPLKFIMDTGAENTILLKNEIANVLHIPRINKIKLQGSDLSNEINAYVSNGVFIQVANCQPIPENIIILDSDFLELEHLLGTQVDGILGASFLKGLIVKIDYDLGEITFANPHYSYRKMTLGYTPFDMIINNGKPYLECNIEVFASKNKVARMLLDTGAGISFMVHNNTDSLLSLPQNIIKGNLGKGLGGDIQGFNGRAHKLSFGKYDFKNAYCLFQEIELDTVNKNRFIRNGMIGNFMLERFDVVFDFHKEKLYLRSKRNYNKEFQYDRSGLIIFAYGVGLNQYFIKDVIPGSPGDIAGLKVGDIITKVGLFSTKFLSLQKVNERLTDDVGKKIKIKVKRGDTTYKTVVTLQDLF